MGQEGRRGKGGDLSQQTPAGPFVGLRPSPGPGEGTRTGPTSRLQRDLTHATSAPPDTPGFVAPHAPWALARPGRYLLTSPSRSMRPRPDRRAARHILAATFRGCVPGVCRQGVATGRGPPVGRCTSSLACQMAAAIRWAAIRIYPATGREGAQLRTHCDRVRCAPSPRRSPTMDAY